MDLSSSIAKYIEHSNLKPDATKEDIKKLCDEALKYNFYGVCINPYYVPYVKEILKDSDIKVITVVGFPLGANKLKTKIVEATTAHKDGVDELDIVWNISAFKSGEYDYIVEELKTIIEYTKPLVHKIIIETAYLRLKEKFKAVELLIEAGAEFLKTSTGFAPEGAKLEDIRLFKEISKGKLKIKAAGGIRDKENALKMIEFGADRIGTSHGVKIING